MSAKEDSKRRINLKFDDLEQDILEWLNTFGNKRARIAKVAIRKAMLECQTANSLLNSVAAQSDIFKYSFPTSGKKALTEEHVQEKSETKSQEQTINQILQEEIITDHDENLMCLLGLTGSEESAEILKLI